MGSPVDSEGLPVFPAAIQQLLDHREHAILSGNKAMRDRIERYLLVYDPEWFGYLRIGEMLDRLRPSKFSVWVCEGCDGEHPCQTHEEPEIHGEWRGKDRIVAGEFLRQVGSANQFLNREHGRGSSALDGLLPRRPGR